MKGWSVLPILLALAAPLHAAEPVGEPGCAAAIEAAGTAARLPPGLLGAIAIVESGRTDPRTGRAVPWPWTINVAGVGSFYSSKQEAVAAVAAARLAGVRSIDVGCLQINLMHHPNAFSTLEDAFDPAANAVYAAGFLTRLFGQTRSWPEAAASYHSATPGLREDYQRRVMGGWGAAARFGYVPGAAVGAVAGGADDPNAQATPAFRAQLAESRADHARWVAMGLVSAPPSGLSRRIPGGPRMARLARLAEAAGDRGE